MATPKYYNTKRSLVSMSTRNSKIRRSGPPRDKNGENKGKKSPIMVLAKGLDICPVCQNSVREEDKGLNCDECQQWWHSSCCNISEEKYEWLAEDDNILFVCDHCKVKRNEDEEYISNSALMRKMNDMMETMKGVINKYDKMAASNLDLSDRVSKIENEIKTKSTGASKESIHEIVDERMRNIVDREIGESLNRAISQKVEEVNSESREQEARRLNLIWVNLPENPGEDQVKNDKDAMDKVMKKVLPEEKVDIDEITRLGKVNLGTNPRLIKFKVKSLAIKKKILKNSHRLNEDTGVTDPKKKMYINNDYTQKERQLNKELRKELFEKEPSERVKWTIRGNKLVLKDRPADTAGLDNRD